MLLGHIAVPTLLKHYFNVEAKPLFWGSLFPDAIDKSLQQVGTYPNGRSLAHTLVGLVASTVAVALIWGKSAAGNWLVGYLGHLFCDTKGLVPWFYPFASYEFRPSSANLWHKFRNGITNIGFVELLLMTWAIAVKREGARKRLAAMIDVVSISQIDCGLLQDGK